MSASQRLAVTCLSCGSRLRVTDPQLIGSIAHCPKCGGMVEIKLPGPTEEPPRHLALGDPVGIDSEALTQSSIASPSDLTDPGLEGAASDLPADPSSVWQSESSRRFSQIALVAMLGMFGLVAATIGFIQFARSFTQDRAVAENAAASTEPQPDDSAVGPDELLDDSATVEEPAHSAPPTAPPAAPDRPTAQPDSLAATSDSTVDFTGDTAGESDPSVAATPTSPAEPTAALPAVAAPDAHMQDAPMQDAGPAIVPAPIVADAGGGIDQLPPGLRRFVPLLEVSTADNGAPQVFPSPPTIDSVKLDAAAALETDDTPTAKRASIDIPKLLAMRFAIENRDATLSELMLLVSQLTGVPIELEVISLDLAGVSVHQPLATPAGWMAMGQWLDRSLTDAGLSMEVGDGVILVHASVQRLLESAGGALVLDDFGAEAPEVADWLKPLVMPPLGPTDDAAGGLADEQNGVVDVPKVDVPKDNEVPPRQPWTFDAVQQRLRVPEDRFLLVQSICAVETLRLMRGKPTKLDRQQTARWVGRWTTGKPPLGDASSITDWPVVQDGPAGTQLDSPRTLAGLLRRVATENRAAVVVVWHDAMRHQVYPTDLAMPLSDGLNVGAYLDELIGEAGLQARDTGQSVWWIGSEGLYDRYEVITWISIPNQSGEAIAKRIANTLGSGDPAQLPIIWNDSTLVIRAPRYIARQLQRFVSPTLP